MLTAAYPAILAVGRAAALCDASVATSIKENRITETRGTDASAIDTYNKFLSRILNEHLLPACAHVGESHPSVLKVLLQMLGRLIDDMGIASVMHFKHTVRVVSAVLNNPFVTADHSLLRQALLSLEVIVSNGWPRIFEWRAEVLRGVISSWLALQEDEESPVAQEAKDQCSRCIQRLSSAIDTSANDFGDQQTLQGEIDALIDADARLERLLRPSFPPSSHRGPAQISSQ